METKNIIPNYEEMEFFKYYEISKHMVKFKTYFCEQYIRMFICKDTKNVWLAGIIKNMNDRYEEENGCYLIERFKVELPCRGIIQAMSRWQEDGSNWDNYQAYSLFKAYDILDNTFGIILENPFEQHEYEEWANAHS